MTQISEKTTSNAAQTSEKQEIKVVIRGDSAFCGRCDARFGKISSAGNLLLPSIVLTNRTRFRCSAFNCKAKNVFEPSRSRK